MMAVRDDRVSWFERGMDAWRHVIQVSERTLIDNVAATVPWLAPVSPAYMVWNNAVQLLGWPVWVAWVVALAVEGLGLSVVSTAFQLWRQKRNTFWMAVGTTVFYLSVVITVNVALELGAPTWFAKALLSLLSVPAAVTIALRTQNVKADDQESAALALAATERRQAVERAELQRIEAEERAERLRIEAEGREYQRRVDAEERARRHELKLLKAQEKVSETFGKTEQSFEKVSEGFSDWRKVPQDERARIASMTTREVMAAYGTSERTADNWKQYAKEAV